MPAEGLPPVIQPPSPRQAEVLNFIEAFIAEEGYPPTFDEIGEELGVSSKGTVYDHLEALEQKGYITRVAGKARAIVIKRTIEGAMLPSLSGFSGVVDLRFLVEINQAVQDGAHFEELYLDFLFADIMSATGAHSASLYVIDQDAERMVPYAWRSAWGVGKQNPQPDFSRGEGIIGLVWETGEAYLSEGNVHQDEQYIAHGDWPTLRVRSILAVPILNLSGECVGVFQVESHREGRFTDEMKNDLQQFVGGVFTPLIE